MALVTLLFCYFEIQLDPGTNTASSEVTLMR
jgi:hypothetical protein